MTPPTWITTLEDLHAHYGTPGKPALAKVTAHLTPAYAAFVAASRFCILSTVGPEGTDGSPRGDENPVVIPLDAETLAMPDWKGNERIDSLRNIIRDGRVSLIFLVPGSTTAIRVNGTAKITADPDLRARFDRDGTQPRSVIVIRIAEVYSQCARALQRSALWTAPHPQNLPTPGQMLQDATQGAINGADYDTERATRAHLGWW
ncbi:MAG: MSMEG_1061 family FMN-dependent PPOX-type flavoprotein [Pseudomonadota bacterium]